MSQDGLLAVAQFILANIAAVDGGCFHSYSLGRVRMTMVQDSNHFIGFFVADLTDKY